MRYGSDVISASNYTGIFIGSILFMNYTRVLAAFLRRFTSSLRREGSRLFYQFCDSLQKILIVNFNVSKSTLR